MTISVSEQFPDNCPDGVNIAITCPKCFELSASGLRQGNVILWNCKRASCGAKGYELNGIPVTADSPMQGSPGRPLRPEFVPNPVPDYFKSNDITITPLDSFDFERLGHQTRTPGKHVRNWMLVDRTPYSYLPPVDGLEFGFPLWLVEDIRSAETLAQHGQPAVALLGTQIKDRFIEEELFPFITRQRTPKILVALDPDATILAMKQAAMLQRAIAHKTLTEPFLECRVQYCPIPVDIKDMSRAYLDKLIMDYAR